MPRLDDPRVGRIFAGVAGATDLATFGAAVAPELRELLGASLVLLHRSHPGGGWEGGPEPLWSEVMAMYGPYEATDPVARVKQRMRGRVAVTTDLLDERVYRSSAVYSDCFVPLDAERQLVARIGPPKAEGSTVLMCTRSRRQRGWGSRHVALLEALAPAFSAAMARNDRWRGVEAVADEAAPCVAFDEGGRALWMTAAAEELLGGRIPDELASAARALVAAEGRRRLVVPLEGPGPRSASLSLRSGKRSPIVVAILEAPPRSCAAMARDHGLTRAEGEVLEALARGYSNAEIAEYLGIARGTVRIHLSRVYAKLGVSSRTQAVALLRR